MTRLEKYIEGRRDVMYPDDIHALKEYIKEIRDLDDALIKDMYNTYSKDMYCAAWLIINEHSIQSFRSWLLEESRS
jgi:hypothetical protein